MKLFKLFCVMLIFFGTSSRAANGDSKVQTGVSVIKLGKEAKIKGHDLKISFLAVEEDSRCPEGVQCIWAGNGRVRLMAQNKKGDCAEFVLNTNLTPRAFEFNGYNIELARLAPYPKANDKQPRNYEVGVTVTKLKK